MDGPGLRALAAGGQSVPVCATSSAEQVEWIVRDSGARFVIAETVAAGTAGHAEPPRTWRPDGEALPTLVRRGGRRRGAHRRPARHR
ncbi:hypothetical protein M878_29580 [Streptomyces roseochromogenus subsp. oscitans DS 12.976]|uniref:Uncharacterized protein n=1 Tax=Streptomyces roseochromogenus subsp. oscitans DS 12.976 TaxID=1352936 RepID=V6JYH5_STRRC|nr:hypothetical protein M878_29580 [Streptomyces roseochromogenus subsp. oscitans DS 12.976]